MVRTRHNIGFAQAAIAPAIAGSGPAAPFVAAALIAAPFVMNLVKKVVQGCGQTCVLTSDAANQIEDQLKANLAAYQNSGHTRAEQSAALAVFDGYWNALVQYCGAPEFQSTKAGRNCIDDRKQDACKWRDSAGECWNWFKGYRDPIANDQNVKPDASPADQAADIIAAITGKEGTQAGDLLIPAALFALALIL